VIPNTLHISTPEYAVQAAHPQGAGCARKQACVRTNLSMLHRKRTHKRAAHMLRT